ncbi:MAG: Mur ligase family protein, partial [bacterium]|nr:Mur ligase family protein [bacterium]
MTILRNSGKGESLEQKGMVCMEPKNDVEWKDGRVLVVGAGKSGIGAAEMLVKCKERPVLFDENEKLSVRELAEKLKDYPTVEIRTKSLPDEIRNEIKLAVLSPGVPVDSPFVEELRQSGIPIWGEIELAYAKEQGTVAAITGTNGKTTTTTLVGQIMQEHYGNTFVVGNIGAPYTEAVLKTTPLSYTVAEISSFQLETIVDFHPHVSAILNITPDHLNRHKTMEAYIAVKERITKNQTKDDLCV